MRCVHQYVHLKTGVETGMAKVKKQKRRAYGEGSITTRKNGLLVGRMRLGYKPDGSVRIHQVTSMDHADLIAKMDDAKAKFREYGVIVDKKTTVATWGEKWLTEIAAKKLGPNTYTTQASLMRKWVIPVIGNRVVSEVTPADIRSIWTAMEANTVNGKAKPLAPATHLYCYRMLSRVFEDARRNEMVAWNVVDKVDAPRKLTVTRGSFSVPEVMAIIDAVAQDRQDGTRKVIQLFTGMRQGEKLGLTWECVNLEERYIRVAWQLQELSYRHGCGPRDSETKLFPCGYRQGGRCPKKAWAVPDDYDYRILEGKLALTKPKSKAGERGIPLIEPIALALERHRDSTAGMPNPHGLVFHDNGHPIPERQDQEMWKDLIESVGIPRDRTTHWARHSVASLLKAAGVDTRIIGEIVGHGSTAVTEGYVHISSDQAKAAMGKLDAMLSLEG